MTVLLELWWRGDILLQKLFWCSSTSGTPRLYDINEQDSSAVIQFQDAIVPASDDEEGSISEVNGRPVRHLIKFYLQFFEAYVSTFFVLM